ncbi:BMC domain-containing protein [Marininema halotolerans]|uniref:BMC domain-containing protein n=1 Tax=Marininema halotolerans TaxID=1155944 RepID=A0A1I6SUN5_9BACL|nr:BMC domain-containing protein [Marininema halotolerans]SFS80641.1 BMC domain-containing protein [Marininema halotolerans]
MAQQALGMIETIGFTTAVSAADAALKAANVTLSGWEQVIGAGGSLGVTIHLQGDVAAVTSAVQAGREEAARVGNVMASHVIPRAHHEVNRKIFPQFEGVQPEKNEVAPNGTVEKTTMDNSQVKGKKRGAPSSQGDTKGDSEESDKP